MNPVKPENKDRYPDDWKEISRHIREDRAKGRCECAGECGHHAGHRCWKLNGKSYRREDGTWTYPVVLTTAHLDHAPENCEPGNLRAMCQACHLRYDAPRKRAERIARANEGQLVLEMGV